MREIDITDIKKQFYSYYNETCQHPIVFLLGFLTGLITFCVSFGYAVVAIVISVLVITYYFSAKYIMSLLKHRKEGNIDKEM